MAGGGCRPSWLWAKVKAASAIAPRRSRLNTFAAAVTISLAAQTPLSLDNDFGVALGTAGLTPATARFDAGLLRMFEQPGFRTPLFATLHADPWRSPFYAAMFRRQIAASAGKPSDEIAAAGRLLGAGIRRTLIGNPIQTAEDFAKKPGALATVLGTLKQRGTIQGDIPDLAAVPAEVQQAAALVLQTTLDSLPFRRAAFAKVADLDRAFARTRDAAPDVELADAVAQAVELGKSIDLSFLMAGAHDVALACTQAEALVRGIDPKRKFEWRVSSSWGAIVLSGGTDSTVEGATLLCIDTGGNDRYVGVPSNASSAGWASMVIDTSGDDRYLSAAALATAEVAKFPGRKSQMGGWGPGSALFGYSVLVDSAGDDVYRSHRPGLGSAAFGVAVVLDRGGQDAYDAYGNAQGYGSFGVGLLEDLEGDDQYRAFNQAQGHGQTMGVGLIVDRGGNDAYVADDATIDFPSPQSAEHNVSMAQGAANGRRADYLDGHSFSGGVGVLLDVSGNDSYSCGVFGQGVGYWEGVGFLWDSAGNDRYRGQWYVQGASAHFAIGYLEDEAGDDQYVALMNMAQGAGHDFGYGVLIDWGGADKHQAPNLSLGAGNANGIGIFVDVAGHDEYASVGTTLGKAAEAPKGTLRERGLCLGVFLDLGGDDTYPESVPWAKNAARTANWTDKGPTPAEGQVGVFWDR